jgi:signal transduction histidine kinase
MRNLFRWFRHHSPGTALIILVLIASMAVAVVLARQAIDAGRARRAISDAMLRQYAQLAVWEFSRQARGDVQKSLSHTLQSYAHPDHGRHAGTTCDCEPFTAVEHWFEITAAGKVKTTSALIRSTLEQVTPASVPEGGGTEGQLRMMEVKGDPTRFIAMKAEPHLAEGGDVGLLSSVSALEPLLARTYSRGSLLPAVLTDGRDPRLLVDLRITNGSGTTVFRSGDTTPGPYVVEVSLLQEIGVPLVALASMTPAFIAGLDPIHGTGSSTVLVMTLVVVNAVLVAVGLWQLKRERELSTLRARFVAGVSHELRTPLAQIRLFSDTLLLNRVRNADEAKRALEIIGQESTRLSHLVDNVLLFHRRHEDVSSASGLMDLAVFVREVVESFQPLASSRRAQLALHLPPSEVLVRGDRGALRQVLLNLLDNAVKFGPAGQTVTIRVAHDGDAAVLTVDDSGPGVPPAERQRIFKAFERGRETHGTGGAGIGLAVVHEIVTAHHGQVVVENIATGGARFRIMLPLTSHADNAVPVASVG